MFLGGSFTNVFGKKAGGLVKLTFSSPSTSSSEPHPPLSSFQEIMDVSDSGVAMSVATNPSVPTSPIVVGGIFGPGDSKSGKSVATSSSDSTDDVPYPAKIVYPATPYSPAQSTRCIISTDMMSVNACLMPSTPSACCEGIHGAAHAVLQVSHDEVLVGGGESGRKPALYNVAQGRWCSEGGAQEAPSLLKLTQSFPLLASLLFSSCRSPQSLRLLLA